MATKSSLRIVVVDDSHDNTDSLTMLLQLRSHEVVGCYAGEEGIEVACACHPDVMLLDLAMPRLDGCQVARRIREHEGCKDTLLVAVTGFADEHHRQLAMQAGFDHYLIKPVEPSALYELLEARLKTSKEMVHA
jgi:CheY-like chemotaxis protein